MMVFEDQLARLVEVLPQITSGDLSQKINFGWGTESVLAKYLVLKGRLSFPLIWLVENVDTNNLREPNVSRDAKIVILYESQAPDELNPYQHEFDYKVILQPICDNLITALKQSGISRFDDSDFRTQRVKNYSMRKEDESIIYICNAIVFEAKITFSGISSCLNEIDFNN